MSGMAYYEYKFLVPNEKLGYVRHVLETLYGGSDPFAHGVVDSIYYDTYDRRFYEQCLNGEANKIKFRIRGYGDGSFFLLHQKNKALSAVSKIKCKIKPLKCHGPMPPQWDDIQLAASGEETARESFGLIRGVADGMGALVPVIRVKYERSRYRINDSRLTLDSNIEVMGFSNGWDARLDYAIIPYHVLEFKTLDPRPHLPLLGLTRLPQVSFSKFYMGLDLLEQADVV